MKIAFVIPSLESGGAERVLSIMANFWTAVGHEIAILTFAPSDPQPFFNLDPSIECQFLALSIESPNILYGLRNNMRRVLVLRRALRVAQPDVIISFLAETNVLTLVSAGFLGIPVIVTEHTDPYRCPIPRAWALLREITYHWANHIVVLTGDAKSFFSPRLQRKIEIVSNPVMVSRAQNSTDRNIGREKIVLAVGRLSNEKGYDLLLEAFASTVSEMEEPWTLIVIGEGPDRKRLEQLADDLGIGGLVSFRGLVREPRPFYQRAGVFVLSSRYEGFPMGLCEAMAYGCPVIATEYNASVFDLIDPGENGLVVPCGDKQALSGALRTLLADTPLRAKLGAAAKRITEKYGVQQVMSIWEGFVMASGHNENAVCPKHE